MATTYRPGTAYAVVGSRGAALLEPSLAPELVAAVWAALGDGGGVGAVLQVLTGAFGTSLTTIPPFAVVDRQADGVHLAVRGGFVVRVHGRAGEHAVSGAGVSTWHERLEVDADEVELVGPGILGAHPPLPLGTGVVLAAAVRTDLQLTTTADAPTGVVAPLVVAPAEPADLPADTRLPELELNEPRLEEREPEALEPDALEPLATVPGEGIESTRTDLDGDYDFLWGSTVLRSIEDAAVRDPEDEDEDDEPVAPVHQPAVAPVHQPPVADAEPDHDHAPDPAPGWTPPALLGPAAPARLADLGDHDGETILAGGLAALRSNVAPVLDPPTTDPPATEPPTKEPAATTGPTAVLARCCVEGHPNPPEASTCLGCGRVLEGDAVRVIRPTLGRVLLSTGQEIPLDRPLVVGRKPRVSRVQNDNLPRLITVPSPEQDISRSHLEVRLEGWHVLLVDLGSTNGSTLLRPGQTPARLHPREATLAVAGDVVDLGDGIQLSFADLP